MNITNHRNPKVVEASKNGELGYDQFYDAYYNKKTGEWLENKCGSEECEFCVNRPEKREVVSTAVIKNSEELWDADPSCEHNIVCARGGGIKCTKCLGWFCY